MPFAVFPAGHSFHSRFWGWGVQGGRGDDALAVLSLAAWGLVMMRHATVPRDAQTRMMDDRTAALLVRVAGTPQAAYG